MFGSSLSSADEPIAAPAILAKAQAAAASIPAANGRTAQLIAIGEAQAAIGEQGAARETLRQAEAEARKIVGEFDLQNRLVDLVAAEIEIRDFREATRIAAELEKAFVRADAFDRIAVAQAAAGDLTAADASFRLAVAAIDTTPEPETRAVWLARTAISQQGAGDKAGAAATLIQAFEIAKAATDHPSRRAALLARLAATQAAMGESAPAAETLREALAAAGQTADMSARYGALREIGLAQFAVNDLAAAKETLQIAAEEALSTESANDRRYMLLGLAAVQRRVSDPIGAARTLEVARSAALSSSGIARDRALSEIAAAQAGFVVDLYSEDFFAEVERQTKVFSDAVSASLGRSSAIGSAIRPLARDPEAALATIAAMHDTSERWRALEFVVASALSAGDYDGLQAPMRAMAAVLKEDEHMAPVWAHELILVLLAVGEVERALGAAREFARHGDSFLLAYVAWAQAQAGDEKAAKSTLREVSVVPPPESQDYQDYLNYLVALAQAKAGDLTVALSTVEQMHYPWAKAKVLVAIVADEPPPDFQALTMMGLLQ
ncbi:MAG TPA: hypothetical protein VMM15_17890 [Bradyrhizobium sp.]|nr:hypothetical protein [Bradyrhizobium sp.]